MLAGGTHKQSLLTVYVVSVEIGSYAVNSRRVAMQ